VARTGAAAVVASSAEPASDPSPAAAPVPSPRPSPRKWFWIQVGAFRDPDGASRLVERLHQYSVMVATGGRRAEPLARVLVGPFMNRAAAASGLRDLAARGYRAFIAVE
jgi:cell division septation protein DedD